MPLPTSKPRNLGLDVPSWFRSKGRSEDVELYEEEGSFVLTMEMPGFERDEIDLSFYEGRLSVSAEHIDEDRGKRKRFYRTFRMPKEIDPDEISATYTNGVLEIELPILEGATKGREIEIEG